MDTIRLEPNRDLIQERIVEAVLRDLPDHRDEKLRIALLLAVNLLQYEDDAVATRFCNYMLDELEPLANQFADTGEHAFCGKHKVARVQEDDKNSKLAFSVEFLSEMANQRDD